jgi:glycosyltransferase involved in cell wall biosynthesis
VVARLDDEKGVESAVAALALVQPDAHLAVVGEGPLRPALIRIAREIGVEGRLHLLGLRDDVEEVLAAATVVVAPTHGIEAFGFAVAEAMAAARPLVVTDSGAMPWVAGASALVVPRRDPAALAEAICRLLRDEMLRSRLAASGRRRAEGCFRLEQWVERVIGAYEELLGVLAPARQRGDMGARAVRLSHP